MMKKLKDTLFWEHLTPEQKKKEIKKEKEIEEKGLKEATTLSFVFIPVYMTGLVIGGPFGLFMIFSFITTVVIWGIEEDKKESAERKFRCWRYLQQNQAWKNTSSSSEEEVKRVAFIVNSNNSSSKERRKSS